MKNKHDNVCLIIWCKVINNIRTLSEIHNLFERTLETGRKASYSSLFRSECKLILYLPTIVYCVNPAMSKTSVILVVLKFTQWCPLLSPRFYCYRFLLSLYMNRVPENLNKAMTR